MVRMEIAAVSAKVDSGQYNLFVTAINEFSNFRKCRLRFDAATSATNRWNNAERAICIATVLHLDDGARAPTGAGMHGRLQLSFKEDTAAQDLCAAVGAKLFIEQIRCNFRHHWLMRIAYDITNLGKLSEFLRCALGVASRHDDFCGWIVRRDAPDRLPNVAVRFSSHGTRVHDDDIGGIWRFGCRGI